MNNKSIFTISESLRHCFNALAGGDSDFTVLDGRSEDEKADIINIAMSDSRSDAILKLGTILADAEHKYDQIQRNRNEWGRFPELVAENDLMEDMGFRDVSSRCEPAKCYVKTLPGDFVIVRYAYVSDDGRTAFAETYKTNVPVSHMDNCKELRDDMGTDGYPTHGSLRVEDYFLSGVATRFFDLIVRHGYKATGHLTAIKQQHGISVS